ncbi:MAG: hypothetical protein ACSHXW_18860 [Yoonia sp.]|jgi:hypothetical protein
MKLFIATATAALISTTAFADLSTREKDMRLDTSITAETTYAAGSQSKAKPEGSTRANDLRLNTANDTKQNDTSISTRSKLQSAGEGYIYGGYGPGNDSR